MTTARRPLPDTRRPLIEGATTREEIYAHYFWMTHYAFTIPDQDQLIPYKEASNLFTFGSNHCVRMERLYGDIFWSVRRKIAERFTRTPDGRWLFTGVISLGDQP